MAILLNLIGIIVVLGALYLFSSNRKAVDKKMILKAIVIQFVLAFLLVKFPLKIVVFLQKFPPIRDEHCHFSSHSFV